MLVMEGTVVMQVMVWETQEEMVEKVPPVGTVGMEVMPVVSVETKEGKGETRLNESEPVFFHNIHSPVYGGKGT